MDFGKPPAGCPLGSHDVHGCSCVQVCFCELLRIVETVEPALLSCRDALKNGEDHETELKAVDEHLARFRALKLKIFAPPAAEEAE